MLELILGCQRHVGMSKCSSRPTGALMRVDHFSGSNAVLAHVRAVPYVHRHLALKEGFFYVLTPWSCTLSSAEESLRKQHIPPHTSEPCTP